MMSNELNSINAKAIILDYGVHLMGGNRKIWCAGKFEIDVKPCLWVF